MRAVSVARGGAGVVSLGLDVVLGEVGHLRQRLGGRGEAGGRLVMVMVVVVVFAGRRGGGAVVL